MIKERITRSTLWRMFDFLKPRRKVYFIAMLVIASISAAERLFAGFIVKMFVDSIAFQDLNLLKTTVLYWGAFVAVLVSVSPLFSYLWRASIVHGVANMRQSLFSRYQRLPLGFYEMRHSGEAMSTLSNDITAAEQVYQDRIMTLLQAILQGVSASIYMLLLKWDLALLIILSGLAPLIINSLFAKPLRKVGEEVQGKLGGLSERLGDLVAGFQVIRTFSLTEWILSRFTQGNQEVVDASLKRVRIEANLAAANEVGGLFIIAPYVAGAYMAITGQITLGAFMGLIQLNNSVQFLVYSLGGTISGIQGSLAAGDRILAIMDAEPEPERYPLKRVAGFIQTRDSEVQPDPDAILEFNQVHFSYGEDQPTLDDLSFQVRAGQVVAIVGPSGSGKSTVLRLLMGYYPIAKGDAFLYGKPIQTYPLTDLRDRFAFVPQDAYLYSGTILENIRYGKMNASREEILAAAQASHAHSFILELPQGYDTLVGERGARLSGGQRQRIAIARALLKNAPILLLDEATSALDSESETLVQKALASLMRGRTTIVIAHRLSTIEKADMIFAMDRGKIVEQGTHADLISHNGLYSYLHQLQFKNIGPEVAVDD